MRARPARVSLFITTYSISFKRAAGPSPQGGLYAQPGGTQPYAPGTDGERPPHAAQTFTTHKRCPPSPAEISCGGAPMSTVQASDRFTSLPDDQALAATVVALEEHGFSVEVVDDRDAARATVLARIPAGSSVITNTSVTLDQTGIADAINDGGPYESARNKMFALDFATQAQQMNAIVGQPGYTLR